MRTEIDRLRAERKTLVEQVEKLTARTQELEKMATKYREMAMVAENVAKSFQERAEKLATQLKDMLRDPKSPYVPDKPKSPEPPKKGEAPPADIRGEIRDVKDGLAVISIGSDAGLESGQKLEV